MPNVRIDVAYYRAVFRLKIAYPVGNVDGDCMREGVIAREGSGLICNARNYTLHVVQNKQYTLSKQLLNSGQLADL